MYFEKCLICLICLNSVVYWFKNSNWVYDVLYVLSIVLVYVWDEEINLY